MCIYRYWFESFQEDTINSTSCCTCKVYDLHTLSLIWISWQSYAATMAATKLSCLLSMYAACGLFVWIVPFFSWGLLTQSFTSPVFLLPSFPGQRLLVPQEWNNVDACWLNGAIDSGKLVQPFLKAVIQNLFGRIYIFAICNFHIVTENTGLFYLSLS